MEKKMKDAKLRYEQEPSLDHLIWYGRRVAYTGDFQKAIQIYTKGLETYPNSPELYRHRGHRYISSKMYEKAIGDLETAKRLTEGQDDVIEQDGIPNSKNIPLSTLHFNIFYHLGLAHYLLNNLNRAYQEYQSCLKVSKNDDSIVACKYWLYLITQKMGKPILFEPMKDIETMEIIENFAYYYLLQLYQGLMTEVEIMEKMESELDKATISFGIGMYYFFNQNNEKAKKVLKQSIKNNHPAAFGTLAAEAELNYLLDF